MNKLNHNDMAMLGTICHIEYCQYPSSDEMKTATERLLDLGLVLSFKTGNRDEPYPCDHDFLEPTSYGRLVLAAYNLGKDVGFIQGEYRYT